MLVTLLLLMLEVPGRPVTVIPREALEVGGVGGRGGRGGRCKSGNGGKKDGEKKNGQTSNNNTGNGNVDGAKGGNVRCNRCGEPQNGAMLRTGMKRLRRKGPFG